MKYAFFVLTLFVALFSEAQDNLKDFALKRSLQQDGLQFSFTVLEGDKKGIVRYDQTKFYYWLKAQKVVATQGASAGQLLHGTFEAFYLNKQLARKGKYRKGLKNGTWNYWRSDGTLEKSENWRNGTRSGKQLYFDANGVIHKTEVIRGDFSRSIQNDSIVVLKSHDKKTVILKDSLGRIRSVCNYKDGLLHGTSKYYEEGKLIEKKTFKLGEEKVQSVKEEITSENEGSSSDEEKTPGKLKSLWKKLFNKKEKEPKESKKSKETASKEKRGKKNSSEKGGVE